MAIRVTFTYSGYVAQNLAAGIRVGNCRAFHDCLILFRLFASPTNGSNSDRESSRNFQSDNRRPTNCWGTNPASMYSTLASEILRDRAKSPIGVGLVSLMKSMAGTSDSSAVGVFGISPIKAASVLPFLQGSRWLLCNEPAAPGPNSGDVDKGGTLGRVKTKSGSVSLKISGTEFDVVRIFAQNQIPHSKLFSISGVRFLSRILLVDQCFDIGHQQKYPTSFTSHKLQRLLPQFLDTLPSD